MIVATLAIVVVITVLSVFAFLRTAPREVSVAPVQRFNRHALVYLAVLWVLVLSLLAWRINSMESVMIAISIFTVVFAPMFLLGAGFLRSRLFSSFHSGDRSTV